MVDRCELHLKKYRFAPGETIYGTVHYYCFHKTAVRNICVQFKGSSQFHWSEGKSSYRDSEKYLENEIKLLASEITLTPGTYRYPFTFTLPNCIPSSLDEKDTNIKYKAKAIIDLRWSINYSCKTEFVIFNPINLNLYTQLKEPFILKKTFIPTTIFSESGRIKVRVMLPKTGFAINEMVSFKLVIVNNSTLKVHGICFYLIQGFTLITLNREWIVIHSTSQEYEIVNGVIPAGGKRLWKLQLRILNMFHGNISDCNIIKPFCELRGEICLPFLHNNLKIKIPLFVGTIPIDTPNTWDWGVHDNLLCQ